MSADKPKEPPPTKGYDIYATREAELHRAVGEAISKWARLEFILLQVFAAAIGVPIQTAAALFFHVKAFHLALQLSNSAVQSKLEGGSGTTHWNSLIEYLSELSGDRNYIAHTTIIAHGPGNSEGPDWISSIPKIGPSIIGHLIGQGRSRPVDVAEACELVKDFQHALEVLMNFHQALQTGEASLQKLPGRVARRRPTRK